MQTVQGEVALLKAEIARRDSARAAQLDQRDPKMQQAAIDSLTATRRAVTQLKGEQSTDLYNIQQQLVQVQELTGQSQQRLTELQTQVDKRGAQLEPAPPAGRHRRSDLQRRTERQPPPIRCTRPRSRSSGGAA